MTRFARHPMPFALVALSMCFAGCGTLSNSSLSQPADNSTPYQQSRLHPRNNAVPAAEISSITQVTLLAPVESISGNVAQQVKEPINQADELSADALVTDVLNRNPSLAQMVAAWEAASARYPQVRSLDDPMLTGVFAPASFGSNSVESGYRVEVSQKIPFPGKLRLRGQGAIAEASAAQNDVEDMRIQLIEAAKLAFYEYYLVGRALSVNQESLRLLQELKENAETRYKNNLVPKQDVLQADVEMGRQQERGVTLERMLKVAIARINTLRSLPANEQLAHPPRRLTIDPNLASMESLRNLAISRRPDLKALQDRIAMEQNALALTMREYYPDLEFSAAYDTIMGNGPARDLAPQVGVRLNIPLWQRKRDGAVAEAHAKINQKRAELTGRINQVNLQVAEAFEQLRESQRIVALYDKSILPAAKENVTAAQAAYVTGKTPFLSLIEAQRNLANLRDRYYEATADYFRRRATLERVIGGPIGRTE